MKKSVLGRPTKVSQGEGGRERLLSAVLVLIRTKPRLASQRTEVAREAGVAPSLVSYYFPDHLEMIEAATQPVVDGYMRALMAILGSAEDDTAKMRSVILLLIRTHSRDPNVVDSYIEVIKRKQNGEEQVKYLLQGFEALLAFFSEARLARLLVMAEPRFFTFALWGMCRSVTQNALLPVGVMDGDVSSLDDTQLVDLVLGLVCSGQDSPFVPNLSVSSQQAGAALSP